MDTPKDKKPCKICSKTETHVHYKIIILESFLPTPMNLICHCGSVAMHDHTTKAIDHIHIDSETKENVNNLVDKYLK